MSMQVRRSVSVTSCMYFRVPAQRTKPYVIIYLYTALRECMGDYVDRGREGFDVIPMVCAE